MPLFYTKYDSELKEKVFVLKGEEGYAKSTDCILDEILHESGIYIDSETGRRKDWNRNIDYMLLEFRIDVLRDIGASYVTLYDNDEVLGVYDFDTNTHAIEFKYIDATHDNRLKLAYDVEHNIYARYMGNKHCLKSRSKSYTFLEKKPDSFKSTITIEGLNPSYSSSTSSFQFSLRLSGEDGYTNQKLKVYDGDTQLCEVTTTDSGEGYGVATTPSLPMLSTGLHTITVVYEGDNRLAPTTTSQQMSVDYITNIESHSSYLINGETATFKIKVTDFLGNNASGQDVAIQRANGWNWEQIGGSVTTDTNGYATFNNLSLDPTFNKYRAVIVDDSRVICPSDEITVSFYNDVEISIDSDKYMVAPNYSATLTGTVSNVSEPVEVQLTEGLGSVTTDANGNFSSVYYGRGQGNAFIFASIDNVEDEVEIEDVYAYWDTPRKSGGSVGTITYGDSLNYSSMFESNANLTMTETGYKFSAMNNNPFGITLKKGIGSFDESYIVSFIVVTASKSLTMKLYGEGTSYSENGAVLSNYNFTLGSRVSIVNNPDSNTSFITVNSQTVATGNAIHTRPSVLFNNNSSSNIVLTNINFRRS